MRVDEYICDVCGSHFKEDHHWEQRAFRLRKRKDTGGEQDVIVGSIVFRDFRDYRPDVCPDCFESITLAVGQTILGIRKVEDA